MRKFVVERLKALRVFFKSDLLFQNLTANALLFLLQPR